MDIKEIRPVKFIWVFSCLFLLTASTISGQNLEVEGEALISTLNLDNSSQDIIVRLPNGRLGRRDAATLESTCVPGSFLVLDSRDDIAHPNHCYTGMSTTTITLDPTVANTWAPTSTSPLSARSGHSAVWTGTEMIVWGSEFNALTYSDGAKYNPKTDTWTPVSTVNAPSIRSSSTTIWTGTEMIVWGGNYINTTFGDGAKYNPNTDTWTPVSSVNAPSARAAHSAIWTGTEMIVWGGTDFNNSSCFNDGYKYNPTTDSWTPISVGPNVPIPRRFHNVVWTGSQMIIYGGSNCNNVSEDNGSIYDVSSNSWTPISSTNGFSGLLSDENTVIWTGTVAIFFGGSVTSSSGNKIYNPVTDIWTDLPTLNAPSNRKDHTAVWIGSDMIVYGGSVSSSPNGSATGGKYNLANNTWTSISSATGRRTLHSAVWSGTKMIVWGGFHNNALLDTGALYSPEGTVPLDLFYYKCN